MVGKNNFKLRREKMGNKFYRYSIKRLSIGVASVAVSAGFLFAGRDAVNVEAAEVSDENQALSQELDPDQNPALSEGSGEEDQETWEIPSEFSTELPDLDEELLEGIDDHQELLQEETESPVSEQEVEGQSPEEAPEEAKGHEEESQDIETEDDSDHTPSQNELDQNELEETLTEDPDEDDPDEDQADQNDQEGQVDEAGQWEEDQTDQDGNREGKNREDLGQPDQEAVTRPDLDGDKTDESKPADHSGDSSEEGSVKPELSLRNYIDPEGKSLTEIITDGFVKATLDDKELDIVRQDGHLLLNQPLQTNGRLQLEAINAAGVTNRRDFDLKEDGTLNLIKLVENKLENGRLQDSTADSSSQYSNRAANPQPTAGTTRSANTLSRAANDNLSPQSGRDVSNEVIVEGNLQVPTDSYTVSRFLGIPIKKTGNYIQPTSGDSIYFKLSVQVPETVTSGDYIDLHYAPEIAIGQVDVNARTGLSFRERRLHEQIYGTPRPTITDGNGDIIAYIEDDRENNIIRYTFTDYVDRKSNVRFSHTLNHWIDLGEAQNTGEYPLYYRIGDEVFREDTFIDYRQNVRRNGPASTSSVINWVDDKTNTFRATAYFNIDNNYIGTEGRVFYITATEGTEPGAPNAINMDSLDIRVYRVSDGRVLPESRAFDPVAVGAEDITDQVNVESYLTSDNATEDGDYWIDAPTNNSDTYIMVVHGTFDPDRLGPQGEFGMQVQSNDVDYETGQQAGHTSYLVYSVEALSGEGNNIIEGGGEDKEEETGPLYEMTVEDTGYGTQYVSASPDADLKPGIYKVPETGQSGRDRVLYVQVNPDQIPNFNPSEFVYIGGQYYQEVAREVIQEPQDEIVLYSFPRIENIKINPDGNIELIYNDGHTVDIDTPSLNTLVPVIETERGEGPQDPSDDNVISYLNGSYLGDTLPGTWVTIKNPMFINGEPEYNETYRFIPDGTPGENGLSVTIELEEGTQDDRPGTWVNVYQADAEGNPITEEPIESEFIPDGQDGEDGEDGLTPFVTTSRGNGPADPEDAETYASDPESYQGNTQTGVWVHVQTPTGRDEEGQAQYAESVQFVPDGLSPIVNAERGVDKEGNSGVWVTVLNLTRDPETGEITPTLTETFVQDGEDGKDGLSPRVHVETGFDSDGNAGSWIIVESPLTNPITGEVTYEETNRTFVKDGEDGEDGEDGKNGNYVELEANGDGTYDIIVRGGDTGIELARETIRNGRDGADGEDGDYVRVVDNGNGTYTIITLDGETDEPIDSTTVRDGRDGQDGEDGKNGNYVELEANGDGTYDIIVRGGDTGIELARETIRNGRDGADGKDGNYVQVVDNGNGTYTIITLDGETDEPIDSVIVRNGRDGQDGEDGQDGKNGNYVELEDNGDGTYDIIVRGGDTGIELARETIRNGRDGADGENGNYVQVVDNGNGTYTIITLDGETDEPISSVTVRNGEDGQNGLSPRVSVESGFDSDGNAGSWIIVESPLTNPITGEVTYEETNRTFVKDGEDGKNGNYVELEANGDGTYDIIVRGGDTGIELARETIRNGRDGADGEDGDYVRVVDNGNGTYTIITLDGETDEPIDSTTVRDGRDGQDGEDGKNGNYVELEANGDGTYDIIVRGGDTGIELARETIRNGRDGADGEDGDYVQVVDNGNGTYTIITLDGETDEPIDSTTVRDGLTPFVTSKRGDGPANPADAAEYAIDPDGYDGDTRPGTWVTIVSPTFDEEGKVQLGQPERRFIPDGQDGESITASTQPGELGGRTGVWIIIKDRNTGAELDRTFVANGEDGQSITANVESGVVNERPGTWVIIRDRETGQELDRNFIYDGQSIIASVEPGTLGDRTGTWVIIKDRHTGDEIDRNFIYNGQNGEDGQSITANVEPGVFNGRPGTWVIIRDRHTNQELDRNFIFDGQNGKDGNYVQVVDNGDGTYTIITFDGETDKPINSVTVSDGEKGDPGRDGNYVELVANDDGTYTIINRDGETHEELSRATIQDGENGKNGNYVQVVDNGDGTYTIITFDGETDKPINSVTVSDGEKGEKGDKGDPGRDGRSITAQVERGEQNGRPGTWINIYEVNPVGSLGSLIDREFVFDGKDGQAPTIRTEPIKDRDGNELGIQVIVTGPNGEHISTDTIFHGRDGQDGDSVKVRDNQDGSYTIIAVGGDGSEEVVGTIRNGKDGEKGEKGDKGDKGEPGRDGQDGSNAGNIIIDNTNINTNENGDIVITIEGQDPVVIPNPDKLANPIQNMRIDDQGNLIVELTDGRTINAGYARGPQGEPGKDGKSPIISTREVSEGIEITVTNPDGSQHSHIVRHGEDGQAARIISTFKDEHGNTRLIFNDGTEVVISGYENGEKDPNTGDIINVNLTINVVKEGSTDQPSRVLTQANIDNRGHLILTYSNGETEDLGKVTASTDRTVVTALVNSDNELILVYSDGSTQNAGQIDIKEGPRGKSAYELWLEAGNTGSLQDFLDSLKGEDGQDGKDAEVGKVVQSVDINLDGDLVINYTDNSQQIIHNYPSSQDPSANGIKDARVDANGDLIITLDDGSQINAGNVRGPQGEPGADGRGIANIRIENNNLVVVYTDFSVNIIGQLTPSQPGDNQPGETPGQEEPGGSDGDTDKPDDKPGQDKPSEPGDGTGQPDDKPGQEDPGEPDSDPEEPGKPNGDQPDDDEPGQTPGDGSDDTGDKPGTDQPGETPGQSDGDNTDEPGQDKPGLPDGDNTDKPGQPGDDQSGQIPGDGSDNSGDKPGESDDVPVAPGQPGDDTDQSGNDDPGQTHGDGSDDTGDKPGTDQPGETPGQSDGDNTDKPGQPDEDTDKPGTPDDDLLGESDGDIDKPGTSPAAPAQPGQNPGETDQPGDQPTDQPSQPTDGQDQAKPGQADSDRKPSDEQLTYTRSGFPGTQDSKDFSFVQDPEDATLSDNLTKDEGQRLPDTASLTWVLGLIGASSLMGGSALALKDRKRK